MSKKVLLKDLLVSSLQNINILEKEIEERICANPNIIGLGKSNLSHISSQRRQRDGIVDIILQDDDDDDVRYIVEIQRGRLDPNHIVRLIEYWDSERKIRPDFEYKAILIAEDITRYLNVLSILQKALPLIAIQMVVAKISEEEYGLFFTKILDYIEEEEDMGVEEKVDRDYWEKKSSSENMKVVDKIFELLQELNKEENWNVKFELNYTKHYIGIKTDSISNNFITAKAKKSKVHFWCNIFNSKKKDEKIQTLLQGAEIINDVKGGIDIKASFLESKKDIGILKDVIRDAYNASN